MNKISVSKERVFTLTVLVIGIIFIIIDDGVYPDEQYQSFFSMGFITILWIMVQFGWLTSKKNSNKEKTMVFTTRIFFLLPLAFLSYDFGFGLYESFPITDIFGWIIVAASGTIIAYMVWMIVYDWNAFITWAQSIKIKTDLTHIVGLIGIAYIIASIVLVSIPDIMFLFGGSILGIFIIILMQGGEREASHPLFKRTIKPFLVIIIIFVGIVTAGEIYIATNLVTDDMETQTIYDIFTANPVNLLILAGVIFMAVFIINKLVFGKSKYDEDFKPYRLPKD